MKFNENLKYLRKREGLTQEELAEKLNVSRQSVTKWESGQSLPDIEKIKEISYMFSVSVDSLIGEVESKTTNKIKKKIDDIGWFMFGFIVLALIIIYSLHNFFAQILQNDDVTITVTIAMVIITFIFFVVALKRYLKSNTDKILNMKDDNDGRRERIKYIVKKYIIIIIEWLIFSFVFNIEFLPGEKDVFFRNFIRSIGIGTVLDLILGCCEYISLERKVKELNK